MGAISAAIAIHDGLTGIVNNMYKSMNTLISAFEGVHMSSGNMIDTSALNSARESMASAVAGMGILEQSINSVRSASEGVFNWSSQQGFSVFGSGGMERLTQEMNSFESLTEKIMHSQNVIKSAALDMRILPDGAERDILKIDTDVRGLITSMQELKNINKDNFSSEQIRQLNTEYESMRQTLASLINLQSNIRSGISDNNISAVNSGFNQLLSNVEQTQMRVRAMSESLREMTAINWQNIASPQIFNSTGIERAIQEFSALQSSAERFAATQNNISRSVSQIDLLGN